ncbi:MAG: peptidase dimerization domain-containing protein, partial [candidate division Zixibacteria bacterium]|nr:peptidase dimerization domain-containing protein [candidate division Zixibacteria bacterium]NIS48596.1 peptidase dimerization domain-containing protein [candidate division Zixibacteria bacterium]NIU16667.1 peptidase dimerization domain-containing protein [candidate division Zixibacteria bacterium]NIV08836.1 peptidase dimerization domain-containing protein [candidate division Zixibacteria bacterium]NIW49314.1 peptidase dimerization domain-containing protein [Gammaproteobacteria bacterium]
LGGVDHRDVPFQALGMRGICYVELRVKTADVDSHSGLTGSIFPNAAWRLTWALNSLKDSNEKILIDGYYDNILPPSDTDIQLIEALPEVATEYKSRYGITHFLKGLEPGPELRTSAVFEPTCTICGLKSGYQGDGSKT